MANVIHECPADGSLHSNDPSCTCRPVRSDGPGGDVLWRHFTASEQFARATSAFGESSGVAADRAVVMAGALDGRS